MAGFYFIVFTVLNLIDGWLKMIDCSLPVCVYVVKALVHHAVLELA